MSLKLINFYVNIIVGGRNARTTIGNYLVFLIYI